MRKIGSLFRFSMISLFVFAFGVMLTFNSCNKDEYDLENFHAPGSWNPNLAVPLIKGRLTLNDLLVKYDTMGLINVDPDNFLSIYHMGRIISQSAEELIILADQDQDTIVSIPYPIGLPLGDSATTPFSFRQQFLNSNGDRIDSMTLKQGTFTVSVSSQMEHDHKIIVTAPELSKNGIPFRKVLDMPYTGFTPVTNSFTMNLEDYKFEFFHVPGEENLLRFYVDMVVYGDNNPNPGPFNVTVKVEQENILFKNLFGEVQTRTMALLGDTIPIDIFKDGIGGNVYIDDPRIGLYIKNSFGLPVSIEFDPFMGHSDINPPYDVSLTGPGFPNPMVLGAPNYSQVGQTVNTDINLNNTNSTIADLLNLLPVYIAYGVEGTLNPPGSPPQNFVLDTSKFVVDVELELPLQGYANGFTIQDTIDFSLSDSTDFIEWIRFVIDIESTFPVGADLQLFFLDDQYVVLDSLFNSAQKVIPAASPGPPPLYKVTTPVIENIDAMVGEDRIENLYNASYIMFRANINTADGGNSIIRIYSDNYLDFQLGVQTKLKVELE